MQDIAELIENRKKALYDGLYGISYDGRSREATATVEAIEELIDLCVRVAINNLRNELDREMQKLTQRVSELDGKYP